MYWFECKNRLYRYRSLQTEISPEAWQDQWEVTTDDEETKAHFDQPVLIEAVAVGLDEPFEMGKFGQMNLAFPDNS